VGPWPKRVSEQTQSPFANEQVAAETDGRPVRDPWNPVQAFALKVTDKPAVEFTHAPEYATVASNVAMRLSVSFPLEKEAVPAIDVLAV